MFINRWTASFKAIVKRRKGMKNRKKTLSRALRSLAVASAMGFTVSAAAQMKLSTDGTGDVLIFPYYSVSGGEWTEFAIHNGSDHSKAA